ncbi:amidase family protein [Sinorhizobium meliloti]|uniref:amidase family protein n=1 Tax=Rhizobium meliloti TaxID=382 RepID=UPI003F184873
MDVHRRSMLFATIARQMEVYLSAYDFVLTPTLTRLPAPIGTHSIDTDFRTFRIAVALYTTFLAIINASGPPAANVPVFWTEDGLPAGVQLIGRFGHEADLLKISAQLEEAAPWIGRYAPSFMPELPQLSNGAV